MRQSFFIVFLLMLVGCATLVMSDLTKQFGEPNEARYDHPKIAQGDVSWDEVSPVLEARCAVCHACYDAQCQLKLNSFEGVTRGASEDQIYLDRLLAAEPIRLFEDADSVVEWRKKGFYPVLNERIDTPEANIEGSVLAQMILQKNKHPLPKTEILPSSFDFDLDRDQQCTTIEAYKDFEKDYPLWGMPYGLPAMNDEEQGVLLSWIAQGSPYQPKDDLGAKFEQQINDWESFFNQTDLKAKLMSRYMYEHLFFAHLYFIGSDEPVFFKLLRSKTPPGQPIQRITSRRPFDDPKTKNVYYRIVPVRESIAIKNHMPYKLNPERMARWNELFLEADYQVTSLPSYDPKTSSNPFITFQQIPAVARYRFMLEEAQFTIMGFIKGPVCRGLWALNVINDHFWVTFSDPDILTASLDTRFIAGALKNMSLPAESESNASLLRWIKYANDEKTYIQARSDFYEKNLNKNIPLDLSLLWDGDQHNKNAALTVFRNFDSATIVKGLIGDKPQTAWVINYPLLERIHYLLVAGFDIFGNVGHQINSRIYMDFLRMEGESNFLHLLPKEDRADVRDHWYRGSVSRVEAYVNRSNRMLDVQSHIDYQTDDSLNELYGLIKARLSPVLDQQYEINKGFNDLVTLKALNKINSIKGRRASILAQTTFIEVVDEASNRSEYYTLNHNSAYSNISHIFGSQDRRLPEEDTVTLSYGLLDYYPRAFMKVNRLDLPEFANQLDNVRTEADYKQLKSRFGIRRNSDEFWAYSDRLHAGYHKRSPIEAGLFDYNRLENR